MPSDGVKSDRAADRLAAETGLPRDRFAADDKPVPELDDLEPVTDGGVDQSADEVVQLPDTSHIEEGDMFPFKNGGGGVTYGRVEKVDRSRDFQFKVRNSIGGYSWMNATHYAADAPDKPIVARNTAADLYWRVDRYDGR